MSLLAIGMIIVGVWVAIKVAGALLKLVFWGVALAGMALACTWCSGAMLAVVMLAVLYAARCSAVF